MERKAYTAFGETGRHPGISSGPDARIEHGKPLPFTFNNQFYTPTRRVHRCSVSGDTLQYRLEESVSHRRTREVTQLFTY